MDINFRQEETKDYQLVESLIESAFKGQEYSDQKEHILVAKLRKGNTFIKELSLITEVNGEIVAHVLLTKLTLKNSNKDIEVLSLAPISVLPDFQNKGIGGKLIEEAHRRACKLGFHAIVLVGHEDYYPRFNYELLSNYKLTIPFEVPEKNAFIYELKSGSIAGIEGELEFPKVFFD